jgi:hypothetical protein
LHRMGLVSFSATVVASSNSDGDKEPTRMDASLQLAMAMAPAHRNQYLFSDHYLNELLPDDARWSEALPEAEAFLAWLQTHYAEHQSLLLQYTESQLEDHWFIPILDRLDHVFERRPSIPGLDAGVKWPDYVF